MSVPYQAYSTGTRITEIDHNKNSASPAICHRWFPDVVDSQQLLDPSLSSDIKSVKRRTNMAPGMPADQNDTDGEFPKPVATESPSPIVQLSSLQETWEDIRDAVTETDVYIATSEKVTAVSRVASSAWSLSKKVAWVLGTSALVLVIPLLYEIDKELGPGFDPAQPVPPTSTGSTAASDSATTSASSTASTASTSS